MTDLDAAATELTAARSELREALLLAGEWARHRAHDDPVAAHISQRIDAAFARVTLSNITAVTAMNPQPPGA
jgi:hypothetical protein